MQDTEKVISDMSAIEYLHDFIDTYLTLTERERRILKYLSNPKTKENLEEMKADYMAQEYGLYLCEKCGKYKKRNAFTQDKKICKRCLSPKDEIRRMKRKQSK